MVEYQLGEAGRALMVVGGLGVVVVVAVIVVCAVVQPCLLNSLLRKDEESEQETKGEQRRLVPTTAAPQLQLQTPNSKRPSDAFMASEAGTKAAPGDALMSPFSPRSENAFLSALSAKRDSTYSSMSEKSVSPLQSGRNSLCESAGYASQVVSPTVDCASPMPHATGQLSLSLCYAPSEDASAAAAAQHPTGGRLTISVIEARGLSHPHQPITSLPHVYVRVLVWREKRGIRKIKTTHLHVFRTRTIRHCSDPVFREDFVADIGRTDIKEVVVRLVVEAADRLVCPTVLGELTLAMRHLPPASLTRHRVTVSLASPRPQDAGGGLEAPSQPPQVADESPPSLTYCLSPPSQDLGNILLSASFLPTAQRLSVCVIKATDLRFAVAADSLSEFYPYVRVLLLSKGRLLKKKKTGYCSHTANPQWNQTLIFSLQLQQVESVSIVACVCSRQPVAGSADLNGVKAAAADKKAKDWSSDQKSSFDETATNNNSITDSLNESDTINKKNLANIHETGTASNKTSFKNGDTDGVGRGGERYVGKVVFGAHVKLVQARDFYRAIIQSPRTQHTQWHALR